MLRIRGAATARSLRLQQRVAPPLQREKAPRSKGDPAPLETKALQFIQGFPGSPVGKESACSAGDPAQFLGQEDPLEKG